MVQKQQIIISYYRQGISQRQIAKTLGLNRKTVKKYILEYEDEKAQSLVDKVGIIQPPRYDTTTRSKRKLTQNIQEYIDACLRKNDLKRQSGKAKQSMKAVDIHESLLDSGFQISYSTVCQYIRDAKRKKKEVFIRQHYTPGSCSEFDWGQVKLDIGGTQKNMMLAVFTLAYSNHRWAMLFYREDMSSLLQAHVEYFGSINGVPAQIVYDNMKTAVAKFTIKQSTKVATNDLLKLSSYYQFDYRFCNAAKGNEKGHVERSVEYIRRKTFSRNDQFESLEQAQHHLQGVLNQLNDKTVKGQNKTINQMLKIEQEHMIKVPSSAYEYAITQHYRVDKYHTICVDTNHYSIPDNIHDKMIEVKLYPLQIMIYNKTHEKIAQHTRLHAKHQWCVDINHYWKTMITKPGSLLRSEAMHQAPALIKALFNQHFKSVPRMFVELCYYCKTQLIDFNILIQATQLCYTQSPHKPVNIDKIKWNIIHLTTQNIAPCENENQDVMSQQIEKECQKQLQDIQACF